MPLRVFINKLEADGSCRHARTSAAFLLWQIRVNMHLGEAHALCSEQRCRWPVHNAWLGGMGMCPLHPPVCLHGWTGGQGGSGCPLWPGWPRGGCVLLWKWSQELESCLSHEGCSRLAVSSAFARSLGLDHGGCGAGHSTVVVRDLSLSGGHVACKYPQSCFACLQYASVR